MNDMISRAYAITLCDNHTLMKEPDMADSMLVSAYKAGFRDAITDMKNDLMTIRAREDWIPVEVGLPRYEGEYMITDEDANVWTVIFSDGEWITFEDGRELHLQAIAWQAMPRPYKPHPKKGVKRNARISDK